MCSKKKTNLPYIYKTVIHAPDRALAHLFKPYVNNLNLSILLCLLKVVLFVILCLR